MTIILRLYSLFLTITQEDQTLVRKMIEEGKIIYSTGAFSFEAQVVGLKQYLIYGFSLKNAVNKTMFSKVLHGRISWYWKGQEKIVKSYPGIIDGIAQLHHSSGVSFNAGEHFGIEAKNYTAQILRKASPARRSKSHQSRDAAAG